MVHYLCYAIKSCELANGGTALMVSAMTMMNFSIIREQGLIRGCHQWLNALMNDGPEIAYRWEMAHIRPTLHPRWPSLFFATVHRAEEKIQPRRQHDLFEDLTKRVLSWPLRPSQNTHGSVWGLKAKRQTTRAFLSHSPDTNENSPSPARYKKSASLFRA